MDHLLSRAIELGYREVCLLVAPDNLSAVRLYEAYGFHRLGGTDKYGNHQMLKTLD
jgi:ribosomal protein S18 acetylase RimI-like enzyme